MAQRVSREQQTQPAGRSRSYLLVFDRDTTTLVDLPTHGEIVVGRGESCPLRLQDADVADAQVKLTLAEGEARLTDLGTEKETRVNGELLGGTCFLGSGDVVTLGGAALVLHRDPRSAHGRPLLDLARFRQRLCEETERSLRYGRPFSLLMLQTGPVAAADTALLLELLFSAFRRVDVIGWDGGQEFAILLPETSDSAQIPAGRLLRALSDLAPGARLGLARCPADGSDVDALLTGARNAARIAAPAGLAAISESATTLQIGSKSVVAVDPKMTRIFALVERLAKCDLPVLIVGETGAGKEIVAAALHEWSPRSASRMVSVNCAALSESLLESELFGHEAGAFTGASSAKPGLLESAPGGTIFLDEVAECSPRAQAELLRVLETKQVRRLGAVHERSIDVRIVAATNRRLIEEVAAGRFREDLYYRLSAATVEVPALRERALDVPVLARAFLECECQSRGRPPVRISPVAMQRLTQHNWPGNVRELKNVMEYLAAVVSDPVLEPAHLPERVGAGVAPWLRGGERPSPDESAAVASRAAAPGPFRKLADEIRELERARIAQALAAAGGVRIRAAELIGMPLRTLVTKIGALGLAETAPPPRRASRRPRVPR